MTLGRSNKSHSKILLASVDAAVGAAGLLLVVAAAAFYSATTEFPGIAALLPVVGAALLLIPRAEGATGRGPVRRFLESSPARWIGRRSYGWYLWHWPLLTFAAVWSSGDGLAVRVGAALAALALAALTYRYVETPWRKHDASVVRARWVALAGAAASASVIAGTLITQGVADRERQDPRQRAFAAAASDLPRLYHDGCVNGEKDDRVKVCSYGPSAGPTVALYGDSHAAQWFPALEEIAKARGWRIVVAAKTQCAVAAVPAFLQSPVRRFYPCERWRAAAADSLAAYHPTLVFISNAAHYVSDHRKASIFPTVSPSVWESGLVAMLSRFDSAGVHPVLIRDTPRLKTNVPICLARSGWYRRDAERCGETRDRALNPDLAGAEERAVSEVPATGLIDLTPGICPTPICEPIIDSVVAYSDGDHLSASAARALVPDLEAEIDRVLHHRDLAKE